MDKAARRLILRFILAELIIALSLIHACAPKTLPPELKPSYEANEILTRIKELQTTTIALYQVTPKQITKARADYIIKFTTTSAKVILESRFIEQNVSWKVQLVRGWTELKKNIGTPESGIQTIWLIIDQMIGTL